MSTTRTHTAVTFANPYLDCEQCRQPVTGYHHDGLCGCDNTAAWLRPCGHTADTVNVCPSWNPATGCECLAHFGAVTHRPAHTETEDRRG